MGQNRGRTEEEEMTLFAAGVHVQPGCTCGCTSSSGLVLLVATNTAKGLVIQSVTRVQVLSCIS